MALLKKAFFDPEFTKLLEEIDTKEVWLDSLPSFLSSSSKSSSEDDGNQKISTITSLTEVDGEELESPDKMVAEVAYNREPFILIDHTSLSFFRPFL